jgi:AAA ATPase-like protein
MFEGAYDRPMLVGREAEQRTIDALLQRARDGRSAALVVRGEPGIGKSALLAHAEDAGDGMRVMRCTGIESEHELPFAGMHQLVRPSLALVDRLPAPQAAALRSALGLSFDGVNDRFLVSLGLLSLLAEASDEGRSCASSTMPSGSTARRRTRSSSSPGACTPSRSRC